MHLHRVMGWRGPMTHRQFGAWQAWLRRQWNEPTRTDDYLAQIACEVRRGWVKKPQSVRLQHFRLRYEGAPAADGRHAAAEASKQVWLGRFAVLGKEVRRE
jgi:hypothetical protein